MEFISGWRSAIDRIFLRCNDHLVTVNPAPGRYVVQSTWVRGDDVQSVRSGELCNGVLGPDHRHWAQQSPRIEYVVRSLLLDHG